MGGFYVGECPRISPFLKTMGLGNLGASAPLFLRNGELLGHSHMPILLSEVIGTYIVTFVIYICSFVK
jgi:hypothetical protein